MTIILKNKHSLEIDNFKFKCCVGKNGISKEKIEGDNKTPKGSFKLEKLYYRGDRLNKPFTKLKCVKINNQIEIINDQNNINQICKNIGTIPYEILTNLGHRYSRKYK